MKDQGYCGSCWAFSTIGALEGAYFAKYGELQTFSEQQLIDCDTIKNAFGYRNKGCNGGSMRRAFEYFYDNSPMLESEYPYTSGPKDAPTTDCQYSASKATSIKVKYYR